MYFSLPQLFSSTQRPEIRDFSRTILGKVVAIYCTYFSTGTVFEVDERTDAGELTIGSLISSASASKRMRKIQRRPLMGRQHVRDLWELKLIWEPPIVPIELVC